MSVRSSVPNPSKSHVKEVAFRELLEKSYVNPLQNTVCGWIEAIASGALMMVSVSVPIQPFSSTCTVTVQVAEFAGSSTLAGLSLSEFCGFAPAPKFQLMEAKFE